MLKGYESVMKSFSEMQKQQLEYEDFTSKLKVLLTKVSNGDFTDFRKYLHEKGINTLHFHKSLQDFFYNPSHLQLLGKALQNTPISTLYLYHMTISPEGISALSCNLSGTSVLTVTIKLSDKGLEALAKNLANTPIQNLKLVEGSITDIGLQSLCEVLPNTAIKSLDLSNNNYTTKGIRLLFQTLPRTRINELTLSSMMLNDNAVEEMIPTIRTTQLLQLDLRCNRISNAGLQKLVKALNGSVMKCLIITSNNNINQFGIKALSNDIANTNLQQLESDCFDLAPLDSVKAALRHNKFRSLLTAYYAASLRLMPIEEKKNHFNVSGLNDFRYAGGILMHLPIDLIEHVVSFLPLMKSQRNRNYARKYIEKSLKFHPKGLVVKQNTILSN